MCRWGQGTLLSQVGAEFSYLCVLNLERQLGELFVREVHNSWICQVFQGTHISSADLGPRLILVSAFSYLYASESVCI